MLFLLLAPNVPRNAVLFEENKSQRSENITTYLISLVIPVHLNSD